MNTKAARTVSVFICIASVFMVFDTGKSSTIHCLQCEGEKECDETNFDTYSLTRTHCYEGYHKCVTFQEENKVTERRCLSADEEDNCDLDFPQCQSCDSNHCNTQYLKKRLCYVCTGKDCVLAKTSHTLNVVACEDVNARCISIMFAPDSVNVNKSKKDCLSGKDYTNIYKKKCDEAPAMKGFCRICRGHLCNSVEDNFNLSDPLAQQQCYNCQGKDCSIANSNLLLNRETCKRYDAQCISVIYPKKYMEKNVKGCFYGKDDPKNNRCIQAFAMGGFCRICNDHLCNMLLPQPVKLRCYHCLGSNCTIAKSSMDLTTVECLKSDKRCISVTFAVNNKNAKNTMKSCASDKGLNLCANAAEMGGFCRICSSALCNSVENNFQVGDPLPQPKNLNKKSNQINHEKSSEKSSKETGDTSQKVHNLSSRLLFMSSPLFPNIMLIVLYLYVT